MIILADPDMGKSVLTRHLGSLPKTKYCRAGTFDRTDDPGSLLALGSALLLAGSIKLSPQEQAMVLMLC